MRSLLRRISSSAQRLVGLRQIRVAVRVRADRDEAGVDRLAQLRST